MGVPLYLSAAPVDHRAIQWLAPNSALTARGAVWDGEDEPHATAGGYMEPID